MPSLVLLVGLFAALPSEALEAKSAAIFKAKCAQCHSVSGANFARKRLDLTRFLNGEASLSSLEVASIEKVLLKGAMPPKMYTALHKDTKLTPDEKQLLLRWLESQHHNVQ